MGLTSVTGNNIFMLLPGVFEIAKIPNQQQTEAGEKWNKPRTK